MGTMTTQGINIDEEDIVDIEGTGKDGTVVAKDLRELIDLCKADAASVDGDSDSDDE